MSARRLAALVALALAVAAALPAAGASAAPPEIVRPADERSMTLTQLGAELYAGNCLRCHGIDGRGIAHPSAGGGRGPKLRGVGALAADFYLRTGYMPLSASDQQPQRSRVLLGEREIRALVAYVDGLGGGPPIPAPEPASGSLAAGLKLFEEHCAGCHQVVGQGGVVTGARVPPLIDATPREIAQAVRIGPYVMPRFSEDQISDVELNSIIRYVALTRHPVDRGGWGLGNLGPFPEGLVSWLLAAGVLIAVCLVIGTRARG